MPLRPHPPTLRPTVARRPEVLAPAGDLASLRAGLAVGADAVYFGLDEGFNARARAQNFSLANLDEVVAEIHRAGARAYVTLNTLLFEVEIPILEPMIRAIAAAGVDALIVQDPAICLLAHAACPELELHASTQMTVSSAEGARFSKTLGVTRVVVPRELSVTEIAEFARNTDLELEVFVHGALCMSWSGQCLSSEAWGGRSANRGQCAQACRLPYDLMLDGEHKPLGDVRYLLSPKDLNGMRAVPALMEIGVHTLKVEGRLKGPAYVATAVGGMRSWVDAVAGGEAEGKKAQEQVGRDLARMMVSYSRGFGDGFLAGADHQTLVEGRFPKHRGAYLGRVVDIEGNRVRVRPEARPDGPRHVEGAVASPLPPLGGADDAATGAAAATPEPTPGVGIGFDTGKPEAREPGGPLFGVERAGGDWVLSFGRPGPDLRHVSPGDRVWITGDPSVQREGEQLADGVAPEGRIPIRLVVSGQDGAPLQVRADVLTREGGVRATASAVSETALSPARGKGLDDALLASKLGAFGGTCFALESVDTAELPAELHLPVRELKAMRRSLVEVLTPLIERPYRDVAPGSVIEVVEAAQRTRTTPASAPYKHITHAPRLVPLCRTDEQLDAVIAAGLPEVELDWMEMVGLGKAFDRAKAAGLDVTIATVRVQKPGESGFDRRIAKLEPDGILVRHWGALMHFLEHPDERRPVLHGDFSLNVTNSITAHHLFGLGLDTLTTAHDLDAVQVFALLDRVPTAQTTVVVHHHIATFHTEHCVYSHNLSRGRDYRTCGRPCEEHRVALRDREGLEHPVIVDVGCRNTVFNAQAQSAASLVPRLIASGVRRLRAEFVWETGEETARVIAAYQALIAGDVTPQECLQRVGTHEQFGVTAGTMRTLDPGVGPTAGTR